MSAAHERVVKAFDAAEGVYRVGAGQLAAGLAMGEAAQRNSNPVAMTNVLSSLKGMSTLLLPPPPPLTLECSVLFNPQPTLTGVPDLTAVRLKEAPMKVCAAATVPLLTPDYKLVPRAEAVFRALFKRYAPRGRMANADVMRFFNDATGAEALFVRTCLCNDSVHDNVIVLLCM